MSFSFLGQIFTLLTTPPGNLIYHLVLAFSIAGALQGAISLWRSSQFPQARRIILGLSLLLALQVVLFIVSGLAWQGYLNPEIVLPPLDRAITLINVVWIAWLWAFPEPIRLPDAATLLLTLLVVTLFGATLAFWVQNQGVAFNQTIYDTIWQGLSLVFLILGLLALILRRPNGWGYGLAMLILAFAGHLVTLVWPTTGNFPGTVRLTQITMYPILLTLSNRFPSPTTATHPVTATKTDQPIQERRHYSTDPKTFHALLTMAAELDAEKLGRAITRGVAQAMLADLCFLFTLTEDKNLVIACGYDLIREESLDGTAVDKNTIPLLASAIQRGRSLRLPASSTSSDLKSLGQILGLPNPGNLLSVPIISSGRGSLGGILILSPYSNRLWSAEDKNYLANVASLFVPILERGARASTIENERNQARQDAQAAREQAATAVNKYEELTREVEDLHIQSSKSQVQAENLAALIATQEETQKLVEKLKVEKEELRKSSGATGTYADAKQMESELRLALEEAARLQNSLAEANINILELEKRPTSTISSEQVEVIASISQELRQPMSSMVGYTDLLLGESVGILGAMQRKFIERVKSSTERIGGLVEDLIQITTLETGRMQLKPEPIDLNLIIDNAMAYTSTQIREKNITMRLDVPDVPPQIQTDREALQQILIHLLQNASAASQAEGTVTLRVQMQKEKEQDYLLVQVGDTGGGIAAEDVARVFARRYRADNSLIQGLGDTGVGLSIAKTMAEAQKGRIWVETQAGIGSTFSALLPVVLTAIEEKSR